MTNVPQFVDLSSYNTGVNFAAYREWAASFDGIARMALKATEGVGFTDPVYISHRDAARAAGVNQLLHYHFARPDKNTPETEVAYFHSVVGALPATDLIMLDIEVEPVSSQWCYQWLTQEQKNYPNNKIILYASEAYILSHLQDSRLASFDLILANWQYTPDERPACPSPWTHYTYIQYSDKATIPGIPGPVDADIYLGGDPPPMKTISLSDPLVASYFTQAPGNAWQCITQGHQFIVGNAILEFYRQFGGNNQDSLCGLTYAGLPDSPEVAVPGFPGVVIQRFERLVLLYDEKHVIDQPPGSGPVYTVHLYDSGIGQDPRLQDALKQITTLTQQLADCQQNNPAHAAVQQIKSIVAPF